MLYRFNKDKYQKPLGFFILKNKDKVTAHTAIIPTAKVPELNALSEHQRQVYLTIAQHYLVQFMPSKRYLEASVVVEVDGEIFSARATKTMEAGFSAFLKGEESDASDEDIPGSTFDVLQALRPGETGLCETVTVNEKKTTPPPLLTEATLLSALVRVADFVEDVRIKQLLKEKDKGKKGRRMAIKGFPPDSPPRGLFPRHLRATKEGLEGRKAALKNSFSD